MEVFEVEEMGVTGDDRVGLTFESGGSELVIGGISREAISGVAILRENRLARGHLHEEAQSQVGPAATKAPSRQIYLARSSELVWPRES
jgi:hypothetical protein